MQRWGLVTTVLYAIVLAVFLVPAGALLLDESYSQTLRELFHPGAAADVGLAFVWLVIGLFVAAQAILLLVSVDASRRRLKPRRKLTISVASIAFAVGFMSFAIVLNVIVAISRDEVFHWNWFWITVPAGIWLFWGIVFFLYRQRVFARLDRAVGWLLNGSVLQLLVAVPTHVLVRNRGDCCAPGISACGIASGIALMLMAFGPSVAFLYQKRLAEYGAEIELPLLSRWPVRTLVATLLILGLVLFVFTDRGLAPKGEGSVDTDSGALSAPAQGGGDPTRAPDAGGQSGPP